MNIKTLTFFSLLISFNSLANFGGYVRSGTKGVSAVLVQPESQNIKLLKENININLDQRVNFKATFHFKNTSESDQTITLAFPQSSYWEIPYSEAARNYAPGKYMQLNEKFHINDGLQEFDEELYSQDYQNLSYQELKNKDQFTNQLIFYAGRHEAESPPKMPFIIWKLKEVTFQAGETKVIAISFKRPWFFQDEMWSTGTRSNGIRSFEYIFETANTWKDSKIGEFNMSIKFPKEAWDNLNLNSDWFQRVSENEVVVKKHNWSPQSTENMKILWKSKYQIKTDSHKCFPSTYYENYSWRFATDNSKATSWCFQSSSINCGKIQLIPVDPNQATTKTGRLANSYFVTKETPSVLKIINGFAKSEKLANQNAKPKTITLYYIGIDKQKYEQIIQLENHTDIQTFEFEETASFSSGFFLQFHDFYPGSKYEDVCLAEIWLE